ncbi:MAG: glycosyltransferase [Bowdeniella nasicola]|nr:glycosyltransferase [Bowdeniella nasicola]
MSEIAIVHDYLTQRGGAERVVLTLHRMFPDAPIYTLLYDREGTFPEFSDATIHVSALNRWRLLRRDHRRALPLLAPTASHTRVREPLAIVSSSGWAHGFDFAGEAVIYCHTPARWLYLSEQYLGDAGRLSAKRLALEALKRPLIAWDQRAAARHATYIANSSVVRERIAQVYGRENVELIFPPHSVDVSGPLEPLDELAAHLRPGYLLVVSRLMPYKNVDRVILAAERIGRQLLVVGSGPQAERLKALGGPQTFFVEGLSEAQLRWAYANAGALVAVSYEDFGLTPLEASAWGKPTIALRAGGYLDSIEPGVNGWYVEELDPASLGAGIEEALAHSWDASAIVRHAQRFSEERFAAQLRELIAHTNARVSGWEGERS